MTHISHRLREADTPLCLEAAEYIDELEASLQRWRSTDDYQRSRIDDLERALRRISDKSYGGPLGNIASRALGDKK